MPKILVDERGIWFEDQSTGIAWDEIHCLSGSKLDAVSETYTCLTFDFEYGEFVEIYDEWFGFSDVLEAITHRLPGLDPDWYRQVQALTVEDPPLDIWQRPEMP